MAEKETTLILGVISNQTLVHNLTDLLKGTDFELSAVSTVQAGLELAEDLIPDLILLDMGLDGDPLGFCRKVRSDRVLKSLPVLVLVNYDDHDARAMALSVGVDDFISKPFDDVELLSRLRTITRLNAKRLMITDLTRFTWMASHAQDGYLLLDTSGAIHFANDPANLLLNLPEEYLGLPFIPVVEYRFNVEPEETWATWLTAPAPCFLIQPETPTARAVWIMVDSLDTMLGTEHHRIVRLRDVTERMSIYQDMRRFHTVVAHKLRTPVSMLLSSTSLLRARFDQFTGDEVKEVMAGGIKGIDRLAKQVQEILTYIDAPVALSNGEPIALERLPNMVRRICEPLHLTNVVLFLPERLNSKVVSLTYDALESILYELLSNAKKFHPETNPTVEVSVGDLEDGYIKLRVADDGQTLSTEQFGWAWIPYVQGEKDFTGEMPGMGLGFPMVASLVWKAGGNLWLRNRHDGPGVIVEMKIPLEATARKFERPAAPYSG